MSTAIYVKGSGAGEELLFSFGEGVDLDIMCDDVLAALESQGVEMVSEYMVTSSEYLDVDLLEMMEFVQREVYNW